MPLCKCATDFEWTEAMYGMAHHPQCLWGSRDLTGVAAGSSGPELSEDQHLFTIVHSENPAKIDISLAQEIAAKQGATVRLTPTGYPPDPFESDEAMLAACERAAAFWNIRIYPEMGTRSTGATGEPFITLALGGEVAEADSAKFCATGERIARERFVEEFYSFCRDRADVSARPVLYWREKPNLQTHHCTCCGYDRFTYQVWARCLISTKPILPTTESSSSASR